MRYLKTAALACLFVLIMAGASLAGTAQSKVNDAADLARNGNPVKAAIMLTEAIDSGELSRQELIIAYRNRAASNLLVFEQAFPLGFKEKDPQKREIIAKACAVGLAMARKDANKVLEMAPGDEGAKTILAKVEAIVEKLQLGQK